MTLDLFILKVKDEWTSDGTTYGSYPTEYDEDISNLQDKFYLKFIRSEWTDTINKEVEELWLRKNSKLAKALK